MEDATIEFNGVEYPCDSSPSATDHDSEYINTLFGNEIEKYRPVENMSWYSSCPQC